MKTKTKKIKNYSAEYLAIVLSAVLLLEGMLFGVSNQAMWQDAASLLDMSSSLVETSNYTLAVLEPLFVTASDIHRFYELASTQMMILLDISGSNTGSEIGWIINGVSDFYSQASVQTAQVLDVSAVSSWPGSVAGISVSK